MQIAKHRPNLPLDGDISLKLVFYMPRPKHHYRTGKYAHLLREDYKDVVYHSFVPDIDNLCKFYMDLLQGKHGMICDDSQICILQAEKLYGEARTEVTIKEI